jgi:hypothetical protein
MTSRYLSTLMDDQPLRPVSFLSRDGWRQRHPKLARWYKDFAELPGMKATQPPAS